MPASFNSGNISLQNAFKFLQEGQYLANPTTTAKNSNHNGLSQGDDQSRVEVTRPSICGYDKVTFEVLDSVQNFSTEKWKRVVAVFTNGQEWMFKDWPTKKYVELFLRVRGYYLHYSDTTTLPEFTQKWNIKTLSLQRNKRH